MNPPSIHHIIETADSNGYFLIDNHTSNPLVLFGNCHMGPLAWFLNILTNKFYDIYIIISYSASKNGTATPAFKNIIIETVRCANLFIYQHHNNSYGIDANIIDSYANCPTIRIPNMQLRFTDYFDKPIPDSKLIADFDYSLQLTTDMIKQSDFPNFNFVVDNVKTIRFFDIPSHPTQYLLYLLSLQIYYRITNHDHLIGLQDYFDCKKDPVFIENDHIILGRIYTYRPHQCMLIGFDLHSEHYVINPVASAR